MTSGALYLDNFCQLEVVEGGAGKVQVPTANASQVPTAEASVLFRLQLLAKENRFNPEFCQSLSNALDHVQRFASTVDERTKLALLTCGNGRFFSNGLDLGFLLTQKDPNSFLAHTYRPLMARMLALPMPTIALVNGHAFAAGMVMALCHDYRIVYPEARALWSMNELLIKAVIPAGMMGVLRAKVRDPQVLRDCIMADRWTTKESLSLGLADCQLPEASLDAAADFARAKACPRGRCAVLQAIKCDAYKDAIALLASPQSDVDDPFRFALGTTNKA